MKDIDCTIYLSKNRKSYNCSHAPKDVSLHAGNGVSDSRQVSYRAWEKDKYSTQEDNNLFLDRTWSFTIL